MADNMVKCHHIARLLRIGKIPILLYLALALAVEMIFPIIPFGYIRVGNGLNGIFSAPFLFRLFFVVHRYLS